MYGNLKGTCGVGENWFAIMELKNEKKIIYGLKQSPRGWFGKFQIAMVGHNVREKITVLLLYVNDIMITGNDTCEIANVK